MSEPTWARCRRCGQRRPCFPAGDRMLCAARCWPRRARQSPAGGGGREQPQLDGLTEMLRKDKP